VTNAYTTVQWNRHKKVYDLVLWCGILLFLAAFYAVGRLVWTGEHAISDEILAIRALAACAFTLLTIILGIGPLARLNPRFLVLLYNRRHLGVSMFVVALAHGVFATLYYGGFGVRNPLAAMLANTDYASLTGFPFVVPGMIALLILFLMAGTSHDFWLKNLSPGVWKALHMGVYSAYALLVAHVALGVVQSERSPLYPALLGTALVVLGTLHLAAGLRERARDRAGPEPDAWIDAGSIDDIPLDGAVTICPRGRERVAVYRYTRDGREAVSAVSNVCAHQHGPLGEGRIIDGCITCPWHGYQYLPHNGQSPPPYTEKIPTYRVRIEGRRVMLDPGPLAPGTPVEPAPVEPGDA